MDSLAILKNASVFAPQSMGTRHLLLAAGKILSVSERVPEIANAEVIDCEGKRLLPGFIDGHAHITGGGGEAGFKTRVPAPFLAQFTSAGVTTVVGVLGTDDTTRDTKALLAQVQCLREEGLEAFCHTGGYHVPPVTFSGSVRDDVVFLEPVLGVGELAISDHRSSQPTLQELLRIASDVHVAGLITGKAGILHLHLGDGARGLDLVRQALETTELPARVFNPTHVNRNKPLFEEAIELARLGSYVDITAFPIAEDDDAWPAEIALQRYFAAGAPADRVTVSSDGGGCLPVFNNEGVIVKMDIGRAAEIPDTLKRALALNLDLEQVLPAFTSNAADLLRLNDRGRIAEGLRADLLLLDDDDQISDVMIGGVWHRRGHHQELHGHFEHASHT